MSSDDLAAEQAYLDWAYEQIDEMIARSQRGPAQANDAHAYRAAQALARSRAEHLERARKHPKGLAIGRMDLVEEMLGTYYVGRAHVDGEDGEPAVIDFRAPLGERFFQAGHADPMGIGRRRTFKMSYQTLEQISDEILIQGFVPPTSVLEVPLPPEQPAAAPEREAPPSESTEAHPDPETPPVEHTEPVTESRPGPVVVPAIADVTGFEIRARDLLLDELEAARTGEMHDVVATIQADQDRLMRADPSVPLVIQGGPGTGKTVVGLHRAAWVLYQQREQIGQESILIIGPNPTFLDYISGVLPSLGETSAHQVTFDRLATSSLPAKQRERLAVTGTDSPGARHIKGRVVMARVIANAIWMNAAPAPVTVAAGRYRFSLDVDEVESVLLVLRERARTYQHARDSLYAALADQVAHKARQRIEAVEQRSARVDELGPLRNATLADLQQQRVSRSLLPPADPLRVVQRLLSDSVLLSHAAEGLLGPEEQQTLLSPPSTNRAWTAGDLPLVDEAAALISGDVTSYSHVIVDEAQDLSPAQWRMVRRRSQRGSITILGDLAQRTSPWAPDSWEQILQFLGLAERGRVAELKLGYRIPSPVSEFACRLLPEIAPGLEPPTSFREGEPVVIRDIAHLSDVTDHVRASLRRPGTLAVIAPDLLVSSIREILQAADGLSDAPAVLTPDEAKGLEFDTVVVVEPSQIAANSPVGLRRLFIALTRATHRLEVLSSTPLPHELEAPATCACGLALLPTWRHCPVCGAQHDRATESTPHYRFYDGQLRCQAHRQAGCAQCRPPDGYRAVRGEWRPA